MAAAPAIVRFVGGAVPDALRDHPPDVRDHAGENPAYPVPVLEFRGTPTGIDVTRVCGPGSCRRSTPAWPAGWPAPGRSAPGWSPRRRSSSRRRWRPSRRPSPTGVVSGGAVGARRVTGLGRDARSSTARPSRDDQVRAGAAGRRARERGWSRTGHRARRRRPGQPLVRRCQAPGLRRDRHPQHPPRPAGRHGARPRSRRSSASSTPTPTCTGYIVQLPTGLDEIACSRCRPGQGRRRPAPDQPRLARARQAGPAAVHAAWGASSCCAATTCRSPVPTSSSSGAASPSAARSACILTRKCENATVTLCHTGTRDLAAEVRRADIVVAAAGRAGHHHCGHGQAGCRGARRRDQARVDAGAARSSRGTCTPTSATWPAGSPQARWRGPDDARDAPLQRRRAAEQSVAAGQADGRRHQPAGWQPGRCCRSSGSPCWPRPGVVTSALSPGSCWSRSCSAVSVLAAVHHAEVVAHRVGEPFGSLVLAVAVTMIEVALIVTLMLSGGGQGGHARAGHGVRRRDDHLQRHPRVVAAARARRLRSASTRRAPAARSRPSPPWRRSASCCPRSPGGPVRVHPRSAGVRRRRLAALYRVRRHADRAPPRLLPAGRRAGRHEHRDDHADPPTDRGRRSVGLLLVSLVAVVGLAKMESPAIEDGVSRWAARSRSSGSSSPCSCCCPRPSPQRTPPVATGCRPGSTSRWVGDGGVGLTIPALAVASIWISTPLLLGLGPPQIMSSRSRSSSPC